MNRTSLAGIAGLVAALSTGAAYAQPCSPYWTRVAPGFSMGSMTQGSLVTFDDGSGPAVYTAIRSSSVPGLPPDARTVLRWNGSTWQSLYAGIPYGIGPTGPWLKILNDGSGPALFAYGSYAYIQGGIVRIYWIRRWSGSAWMLTHPNLCCEGAFPWLSADLGDGMATYGLQAWNQGTIAGVLKWTGSEWLLLGGTANGSIYHAIVYDDGSGPGLYASGSFNQIAGVPARAIAKWNGNEWRPLASGAAFDIRSMSVYDDGRGPALYIVGAGHEAGEVTVNNIARWDGQSWSDVGGGIWSAPGTPEIAYASGVFDDGRGPALYIAGAFDYAGGVPCHRIARWDGHAWEPLGAGIGGANVDSFAVFDDPRGRSLFVGEVLNVNGGIAPGIAQWVGCPNCYANCDGSTAPPRLNVLDFSCFLNRFAARDPYANCNGDAEINTLDFSCFLGRFAAGCP
jgi:hypothetical protein